jgi:hypothetical protein
MSKSYFHAPWGNREINALIVEHKVVAALSRYSNDAMLPREQLCEMIGMNDTAQFFKHNDPIVRSAFTMWFHRYLRLLRKACDATEGCDFMLLYPDLYDEDDEGGQTINDGGRGVGLLLAHGPRAVAAILELRNRGIQSAIKRSVRTTRALMGDGSGFYAELSNSKRKSLRNALQFQEQALTNMQATSDMVIHQLLEELPDVQGFQHKLLEGSSE